MVRSATERLRLVGILILLVWGNAPVSCLATEYRSAVDTMVTGGAPERSGVDNTVIDVDMPTLLDSDASTDTTSATVSSPPETTSRHSLRGVKSRHLNTKVVEQAGNIFDSYIHRPINDWSDDQWLGLALTACVVFCCLLPMCNSRRGGYYRSGYTNVPDSRYGTVPVNSVVYYETRRGPSFIDALWALCCFECCCRDNRDLQGVDCCDICCGLMCLELCCR